MRTHKLSVIKDLCKCKGISLKELSESIGVKPPTLQSYFKTNNMPLARLYKAAEKLGCTIDTILKGDYKPPTYEKDAVHDFLTSEDIPHNKIRQADSFAHVWDVEIVGDCLQALEMDRLISNDFAEFFGVYYACDHLFIQLRIKHPEAYIPEPEEENENTDDGLPF